MKEIHLVVLETTRQKIRSEVDHHPRARLWTFRQPVLASLESQMTYENEGFNKQNKAGGLQHNPENGDVV